MTPQPQQEYIITEEELNKISFDYITNVFDKGTNVHDRVAFVNSIRSRPAPAAPNCDNCAELMAKAREYGFEAGRNQTLDELIKFIDENNVVVPDEENEDSDDMLFTGEMRAKIESLRTQTGVGDAP